METAESVSSEGVVTSLRAREPAKLALSRGRGRNRSLVSGSRVGPLERSLSLAVSPPNTPPFPPVGVESESPSSSVIGQKR